MRVDASLHSLYCSTEYLVSVSVVILQELRKLWVITAVGGMIFLSGSLEAPLDEFVSVYCGTGAHRLVTENISRFSNAHGAYLCTYCIVPRQAG